MLNRKITFFHTDLVQKETQANVCLEAQKRGYETEFVDLHRTVYTDADISIFVSHAQAIPRVFSKISVMMLHDLGQSHHIWPDFWHYEKWHKFTAGFLPGTFWTEMYDAAKQTEQKKYLPPCGIHAVGWPKSDAIFQAGCAHEKDVARIKKTLGLKHERTILYAPAYEIEDKALELVEALRGQPYNILIKQFPWDEHFKEQIVEVDDLKKKLLGRYEHVHVVDPEISIMRYLGLADLVLSDESSVLVEALLLEIPSIAVTDWRIPDTKPSRMAVAPYEHCFKTRKAQIAQAVDQVFNHGQTCNPTGRFKNLNDYKNHWFSNLGEASKVTMDKIEEVIDRYKLSFQESSITCGIDTPASHEVKADLPPMFIHDSAIDYADGSESLLLNLCSHSEFDEDKTWEDFPQWEYLYHLCPLRKNLFNWIDFGDSPFSFLELGAGCGALTSHLVTINNALVTAVEGSVPRAQVIQQRCKNAKNLLIHVCNLNEFPIEQRFDFVSLIGVLEYAGKYSQSEDPFLQALTFAAKALKKDGCLLLAIENQIGHKYLAGFPEEHDGRRFEGVSNYPNYHGMRTFDTASLRTKLQKAGFKTQTWLYPYPDYKMPTAVLSESALKNEDFDPFALMEFPTVDRSCQQTTLFNERGYLQILRNLGQMQHFMNSFLVVASRDQAKSRLQLDNLLAAKSNVQRAPQFRTKTLFVQNNGFISVEKSKMETGQRPASEVGTLGLVNHQKYHRGFRNLQELILDALFANEQEKAWSYFALWLKTLEKHTLARSEERVTKFRKFCEERLGAIIYDAPKQEKWISGSHLDLILSNILVSRDQQTTKFVDQEWNLFFDIPLALVCERALFYLSVLLKQNARFIAAEKHRCSYLPMAIHDRLQSQTSRQIGDWTSFHMFENWFQTVVQRGSFEIDLRSENREANLVAKLFRKGKEAQAQNDVWQAIEWFSRIPLLRQHHSPTQNELGSCYFKADLPELALESFIAAVQNDPNNRCAVLNLALTLQELAHYNDAIRLLSSFTKNHPNDVEAGLALADLYDQTGRKTESLQSFKGVLRIDPTNARALEALQQQGGELVTTH